MSEDQLLHLLQQYQRKESEIIEFKEWKTSIPFEYGTTKGSDEAERRRCFYGYCVGIGNEGGGKLIIGVKDTGVIVGTTVQLRDDTKSRIFEKTGQKIEIEKCITYDGKQVLIVYIPSRPKGKFLTFHDVPLMRVDDKLLPMDAMTQRKILLEIEPDWSGLPCMGTTLDDLDERALTFLREKKAEISKDTSYLTCDITTFLNQLSLLTEDGIPNNTCILFIGKQIVAEQKLPAISRYARLYVDEKNDLEDRLTAEQQRSPLLLTIETIMEKIRKYNFPLEDITLFRPDTEYQYSESAIEELLANSLAHRDWTIPLHNEIRQTPFSLCFSNPGVFANDLEKVLESSHTTPYKNQTMADFLSKINLMENERRGLQKVFTLQLSKGVFVHKEEVNNGAGGIVKMTMDGKIKDVNFAKLVLQVKNMHRMHLFLLQRISEGKNVIGEDISMEQIQELVKLGYVELFGKSPQRKARISYDLLKELNLPEKYILNKGIGTKKQEHLIMEFIGKNKTITMVQVYKLFSETNHSSLRVLLFQMCRDGKIIRINRGTYAVGKS